MILNTPIICLSLKYINKNYELMSNISKWIYFELTKLNYKELKFVNSLNKRDFDIVEILIKFNQNKDLLSKYLIYYSRVNYSCAIIELLIKHGINKPSFKTQFSLENTNNDQVLIWASFNSRSDIVKLLAENGVKEIPFTHLSNDKTLIYVNYNSRFNMIKLLLENGADIHAKDDEALRYVDHFGHISMVKFLVDNGANKDLVKRTKLN